MNTKTNDHKAKIESLRRQLAEVRENLRLIQKCKAEFVIDILASISDRRLPSSHG